MGSVVVGPERPPRAGALVGVESATQDLQRAIDEEGLLAVDQPVGAQRCALELGERIAVAGRRRDPSPAAQKPSIDCR
ncbi:MAG TPA: hypothetical protein VGR62_22520 [Candidatus Binatia bacterium]|nr:hypothetical protein [Candidatus Binatia bacterium]